MPKKYIDLDEALELFDADMNFYNWNGEVIGKLAHISAFQKMAREKLLSLPIADVVERKRGKWTRDEFGSKCSCCGLYAYRDKFEEPWESNFCPNCGADMRGDENDN